MIYYHFLSSTNVAMLFSTSIPWLARKISLLSGSLAILARRIALLFLKFPVFYFAIFTKWGIYCLKTKYALCEFLGLSVQRPNKLQVLQKSI